MTNTAIVTIIAVLVTSIANACVAFLNRRETREETRRLADKADKQSDANRDILIAMSKDVAVFVEQFRAIRDDVLKLIPMVASHQDKITELFGRMREVDRHVVEMKQRRKNDL